METSTSDLISTIAGIGIASLILFAIGWAIRFHRVMWLIAGYSEERVEDGDGLADWVGTFCMLIAGAGVAAAAALWVRPMWSSTVMLIYLATVLVLTAIVWIGAQRFNRKKSDSVSQ